MATKQCSKCGEEKILSEFSKNKSTKDGHLTKCKCCEKLYRKDNYENIAARMKTYYSDNRKYLCDVQKTYYATNRDVVIVQHATYRKSNRARTNTYVSNYRASKLNATPSWVDNDAIVGMHELVTLFKRAGILLHVDHIVPLRGKTVCGLHCEDNLQLLSEHDNTSKGNRHWPDMW